MSQPCQAVTTDKQHFGMHKQENNCKTHKVVRLLDGGCKRGTGTQCCLPAEVHGEHGNGCCSEGPTGQSPTMASARGVCLGRMQHPQGQSNLTSLWGI